tara:strand:+ start:168 stop:674 length:507 start_codon:yes stop_codon:yes gene_type:complete
MKFATGDKVLFKKDNLKGEIIKINSHYKVKVLTEDGFEINISVNDLAKIEVGTDDSTSYGTIISNKDHAKVRIVSSKKEKSHSFLKVDLHIELLMDNFMYLDNFEIIQIQLDVCQRKIEKCLKSNYKRMIIVHGIGSGKLKTEVHKLLSFYKLRYYLSKDAGTTEVIF